MSGTKSAEELRQEKFIRMTTRPVEKLILKLAIPTVISMLITTFYNMADTYFVGLIGKGSETAVRDQEAAIAAVGVVMSLMAVIQAFGFFFGHGSGNFVSRALGQNEVKSAETIAASGFFYAVFTGVLMTVLGLVFDEQLAGVLGCNPDFLDETLEYMNIILLGAPINMASIVLNNQMRFQGNATFAVVGISTGAVLNIGLDAWFILGLELGVKGAAFATIIGQAVSLVLLLIGIERSDCIKICFNNLRFNRFCVLEICRGGLPSLGRQGLSSVSIACLNNMARGYGTPAVAAMSVVSRIMMFAASALIGFGQGFQPVCGFNYGAKKYDRVKKAFWFCVKWSFVFIICISIPAFIFSESIAGLFGEDSQEIARIAGIAMRYQLVTFPVMAWVVMSNMMLQTMGRVFSATILAVARNGLTFIPAVLVLPYFFEFTGVMLAQPVADILALVISVPITVKVLRELESEPNLKAVGQDL